MTERSGQILIADDENEICALLCHLLKREGVPVLVAHDGDSALKMIRLESLDVLIVDLKLPHLDGMELLRRAKALDEDLQVIMITAYGGIRGAVEAMRASAYHYLAKPFEHYEVIRIVPQALAERHLKLRFKDSSGKTGEGGSLREMTGPSDPVSQIIFEVKRVAKSNFGLRRVWYARGRSRKPY